MGRWLASWKPLGTTVELFFDQNVDQILQLALNLQFVTCITFVKYYVEL